MHCTSVITDPAKTLMADNNQNTCQEHWYFHWMPCTVCSVSWTSVNGKNTMTSGEKNKHWKMRKTHSPKEDRSWTQEQQYTLTFQQTCLYQEKKYASDTHKEERQEKEEEPDREKTDSYKKWRGSNYVEEETQCPMHWVKSVIQPTTQQSYTLY